MGSTGPDRTVTDDRILIEFIIRQDPAFFPREFQDQFDLTTQQLRNRLKMLEAEGLVESKKVSNRLLYWITDEGYKQAATAVRENFDEG